MASFNNYLEQALLDEVWGGANYTPPTDLYVGLCTGDPGENGSFSNEVVGGNYSRYQSANNSTNWPAASQVAGVAQKQNAQEITFGPAAANWGVLTHFFFADGPTNAANMLAYGELDSARTIENGDAAAFSIGSITITLD